MSRAQARSVVGIGRVRIATATEWSEPRREPIVAGLRRTYEIGGSSSPTRLARRTPALHASPAARLLHTIPAPGAQPGPLARNKSASAADGTTATLGDWNRLTLGPDASTRAARFLKP